MGRIIAVISHALSSLVAAALYFFFVLPRLWELMGGIPPTAGTVLRIITGLVIAAAAVPVALNLARARRPEYGTPALALRLRMFSIAAHVLAGVLIIATAISEIWLNVDDVGQWLFGIYGAAAAIAILGIAAFYLAFVAELPPPPPKPLKPKTPKAAKTAESSEASESGALEITESSAIELDETVDSETVEAAVPTVEAPVAEAAAEAPTETVESGSAIETVEISTADATKEADAAEESDAEESATPEASDGGDTEAAPAGGLRNRRPSGKRTRTRRRARGGDSGDSEAGD